MDELYGDKVRRLRKERNWTQKELASESGVPLRTVQDIEGNKHATVQRANRLALNQALDIEGNAAEEVESWDEDVKTILQIVGALLMTMTPTERLVWLKNVTISQMERGEP